MSKKDVSTVTGGLGIKLICTVKYVSLFEGMLTEFLDRYGSDKEAVAFCSGVISAAMHKYFTRLFYQRGLFLRAFSHRPDERSFVFELGLFSDDKVFNVDFRQFQTEVEVTPII